MYKVTTVVSNSVNNDEYEKIQIALTEDIAKEMVAKVEASVDEWNKPDPSPYGGKMSVRYCSSEIEYIDNDTSLYGLTLGNLMEILEQFALEK